MPATVTPSAPHRARRRWFRLVALATVLTAALTAPTLAAPSPSRTATVRAGAAGADRAAVEAARRFLCPHGGSPLRGGRCRGARAAATVAVGRDLSVRDWDAGLPTAARSQAPCPEGTVSARPLFWNDAVRCLPR